MHSQPVIFGLKITVPNDSPVSILFSAGESSGEQHAASMFQELKKIRPSVRGLGMGGSAMRQAGIDVKIDSSALGVIGLIEVLKHYGEIRRALRRMKDLIVSEQPDLLVCVDYKEFNLKLARFAKKHRTRVLFYISPQVWAWRPGRVLTYGRAIDMMAVIFPFETAYYEEASVPVRYVGHPSVDKVRPLHSRDEACQRFALQPARPTLGILPGSRINEIKRMLPVMLQAAERLLESYPDLQLLLLQAASVSDELLCGYLQQTDLPIKIIKNETYDGIQCCTAVMTTSGTATLEIALLGVPMVIAYRLSHLTYWLGKRLVKTPFIGLPNIIAGREIVKELIQDQATPGNLAGEITRILNDVDYRDFMIEELHVVKTKLGAGGGSRAMARLALEMLG